MIPHGGSEAADRRALEREAAVRLTRLSVSYHEATGASMELLMDLAGYLFNLASFETPSMSEAIDVFISVSGFTLRKSQTENMDGGSKRSGVLVDEILDGLSEALELVGEATRVPYEPDQNTFDLWDQLLVHLLFMASKALVLYERSGHPEDVQASLHETQRTAERMQLKEYLQWIVPVDYFSAWVAMASTLVRLFAIEKAQGAPERALIALGEGIDYYSAVLANMDLSDDDYESESLNPVHERLLRDRLEPLIEPLNLDDQGVADTFNSIKVRGRCEDSRQLAKATHSLRELWLMCTQRDPVDVNDDRGRPWPWTEFWVRAAAWIEYQASPDEIREMRREWEDEAAEQRLLHYFFDKSSWKRLPERARRSLIEADRVWFSSSRGRVEASLGELQVAVETICHVIWERLSQEEMSRDALQQQLEGRGKNRKPRQPGLRDYEWLFQRDFFERSLASAGVDAGKYRPLLKDLRVAFASLRDQRNRAEHDPTRKWQEAEVSDTLRTYLGVGCRGVLPGLLEVLRALDLM